MLRFRLNATQATSQAARQLSGCLRAFGAWLSETCAWLSETCAWLLPPAEVWDQVHHAQELRNALVHNQGQYTQKYLNTRLAHRPTNDELHGFSPRTDDALINREVIPLSLGLVDGAITQLLEAATEVRGALAAKRNSGRASPSLPRYAAARSQPNTQGTRCPYSFGL
jgi:hypothetical protein